MSENKWEQRFDADTVGKIRNQGLSAYFNILDRKGFSVDDLVDETKYVDLLKTPGLGRKSIAAMRDFVVAAAVVSPKQGHSKERINALKAILKQESESKGDWTDVQLESMLDKLDSFK